LPAGASARPWAAGGEKGRESRVKTFHVEKLLSDLDRITEHELDRLPIGMIQLDRRGMVLKFNKTEGELAGKDPKAVIGKHFFDEVAPCTKVREFHGRFVDGVARRELNETFAYTFGAPVKKIDVVITLFYSTTTDTVWVLVSRKGGATPGSRAS
jgi:photoactive yellow protein